MKNKIYVAWLIMLFPISSLAGGGYPFGDDIKIQRYVTDPEALIMSSLDRYGWLVKEKSDGKVTVVLNKNKSEIILDIIYDKKLIHVVPVSDRVSDCNEGVDNCRVKKSSYARWRMNLRRSMLREIHELAIHDAYISDENVDGLLSVQEIEILKYKIEFEIAGLSIKKKMVSELRWKGISSTEVYDAAEKRLLDSLNDGESNKDSLIWLLKGIGYSGQKKYQKSLKLFIENTDSRSLRRYAEKSLKTLAQYEVWNSIIGRDVDGSSLEELNRKRIRNALMSTDYLLVNLGVHVINRKIKTDQGLLDIADEVLLARFMEESEDEYHVALLAKLCVFLGSKGKGKYLATLRKVENSSVADSVKKYARRYL